MTKPYDPQANREWWAQKWLEVLESFGRTLRSGRAHTYAREGHVLSMEFRGAKVLSRVQGTAPEPYRVSIGLEPFTNEQWEYVIETLAQKARFAAKLLAGEMPQDIEAAFTANGLSLFPLTKYDIHSKCSCPDKAKVCKHIGALYYLLGDRFSEDPFILFQLRGRSREQILEGMRQFRKISTAHSASTSVATPVSGEPMMTQPGLTSQPFWQYTAQLDPSLVVIAPMPGLETVLDLLGSIPLLSDSDGNAASGSAQTTSAQATSAQATSTQATMNYLQTVYQTTSQQAVLSAMNVGASSG